MPATRLSLAQEMAALRQVILAGVLRIAADDDLLALALDMRAAILTTQVLSHVQVLIYILMNVVVTLLAYFKS